jgi:hypothetical protein
MYEEQTDGIAAQPDPPSRVLPRLMVFKLTIVAEQENALGVIVAAGGFIKMDFNYRALLTM